MNKKCKMDIQIDWSAGLLVCPNKAHEHSRAAEASHGRTPSQKAACLDVQLSAAYGAWCLTTQTLIVRDIETPLATPKQTANLVLLLLCCVH